MTRKPARLLPWWCRLAVFGAMLAPTCALSAAIELSPVVQEVPAGRSALAMTVSNRSATPVTVQVRAFDWSQPDGSDQLLPAAAVLLSPPIFTLEPGRSQIVRALLPPAAAAVPARERTWRLFIDEIPGAHGDAATTSSPDPIRFALRLSTPVFQAVPAQAPAALDAHHDDGAIVLRNQGGRRTRLRDIALVGTHGERWALPGPPFIDLLAGAQRRWSWPVAAGRGGALKIVAVGEAGAIEVPLASPASRAP